MPDETEPSLEDRAVTAEREARACKMAIEELLKHPRWVSRQGENDSVEITVSRRDYMIAAALVGREVEPPEVEKDA